MALGRPTMTYVREQPHTRLARQLGQAYRRWLHPPPADAGQVTGSCSRDTRKLRHCPRWTVPSGHPAAVPRRCRTPDTAAAVHTAQPDMAAAPVPHRRPGSPCRADTGHAHPTWKVVVTCGSSGLEHRVRPRTAPIAMSTVATAWATTCPRRRLASGLSAGHFVWGGRPPQHQPGRRHQPSHACRTPSVRTVSGRTAVVPEAADGQPADRSGSLQLPLLFLQGRPAGGSAPWGRLTDAVRQYTSPGVAFVSITLRKPQMHIAVSVSTEQASRVRTRPEYCCTTKGDF
jgi:hypothetical protein